MGEYQYIQLRLGKLNTFRADFEKALIDTKDYPNKQREVVKIAIEVYIGAGNDPDMVKKIIQLSAQFGNSLIIANDRKQLREFIDFFEQNVTVTREDWQKQLHACVMKQNVQALRYLIYQANLRDFDLSILKEPKSRENYFFYILRRAKTSWFVSYFWSRDYNAQYFTLLKHMMHHRPFLFAKESGQLPLIVAVENKYEPLVLRMIQQGADPFQKNRKGYCAFERAARIAPTSVYQQMVNNMRDYPDKYTQGIDLDTFSHEDFQKISAVYRRESERRKAFWQVITVLTLLLELSLFIGILFTPVAAPLLVMVLGTAIFAVAALLISNYKMIVTKHGNIATKKQLLRLHCIEIEILMRRIRKNVAILENISGHGLDAVKQLAVLQYQIYQDCNAIKHLLHRNLFYKDDAAIDVDMKGTYLDFVQQYNPAKSDPYISDMDRAIATRDKWFGKILSLALAVGAMSTITKLGLMGLAGTILFPTGPVGVIAAIVLIGFVGIGAWIIAHKLNYRAFIRTFYDLHEDHRAARKTIDCSRDEFNRVFENRIEQKLDACADRIKNAAAVQSSGKIVTKLRDKDFEALLKSEEIHAETSENKLHRSNEHSLCDDETHENLSLATHALVDYVRKVVNKPKPPQDKRSKQTQTLDPENDEHPLKPENDRVTPTKK